MGELGSVAEELSQLPEDVQFLHRKVSEIRGTSVYPIKPHNNHSIDDTGYWYLMGRSTKDQGAKLTTKQSVADSGSYSVWIHTDSN